jgi:hypothetical protein
MRKESYREILKHETSQPILKDTPGRSQERGFSVDALNKAHKDYLKMLTEREEWVKDSEIVKYIRSVPWNVGSFIRKEFEFRSCFKMGHEYLYYKKDLIALGCELEKRNIDLKRYKEFLEDKTIFEKKLEAIKNYETKKPNSKFKNKTYKLPSGIKNITTSNINHPPVDIVIEDLSRLKHEFEIGGLGGYIDIYNNTHAMLKKFNYFQKYLEPGLKRRCRKWCNDFNYARHALELINGGKEKFY